MNKQKQIEEEVLKIGIKAKEASLRISLLKDLLRSYDGGFVRDFLKDFLKDSL